MLGAFVAAIFVVILGLTGSIMAFEDEIDHLTNPRLFRVEPVGNADAARRSWPEGPRGQSGNGIGGYGMGVSPDLSYYVSVGDRAIYVNQYTGEILGERSGPTWLSQVHQLHLRLLAGAAGKTVVSWAGVLTLLLTISGLYLWWPVRRLSVNWAAGGRRRWFDLHNTIGVLAFVFLFVLSLTGIVIGFESVTSPMFYRMTNSQPYPFAVQGHAEAQVRGASDAGRRGRGSEDGAAWRGADRGQRAERKVGVPRRDALPGRSDTRRPQPRVRRPVHRRGRPGGKLTDDVSRARG